MSSNGTKFHVFIEESLAFLAEQRVIDYYQEPLPSATDERMAAMVDRFMEATTAQRERFQAAAPESGRSLFGIFGHRAATLAARQESREWLRRGLAATAVANYVIPPRRNVDIALAVHHHCARKLGVNTVDLFAEIAAYAGDAVAGHLQAFGRRSDVTLGRYGWRELKTAQGVKYSFEMGRGNQ